MIGLHQFFAAYLHCNFGDVSSFAGKSFYILWYFNCCFRVNNSCGVFLLRVSGSAWFFLLSKLYVCLEISIKKLKSVNSMVWI